MSVKQINAILKLWKLSRPTNEESFTGNAKSVLRSDKVLFLCDGRLDRSLTLLFFSPFKISRPPIRMLSNSSNAAMRL